MASLLEKYESNPEQDLNTLLEDFCKENSVPTEDLNVLNETNEYLDGFAENAASLAEAKENGWSRSRWLLNRLDESMEECDEKEKAEIVTAISESTENVIKEELGEEE